MTLKKLGVGAMLDAVYAEGPAAEETARAQARVRRALRAEAARAPEPLWYARVGRTPIGPIYVAVSARGLASVRFEMSEAAFLDLVRRQTGQAPRYSPARAGAAARQVAEYVAGKRAGFDVPVDLSHVSAFQRQVLLAASQIPRGQVRTYAELAREIGRPRAARAVGQALSHNPVPIVVPCHRVLAADGALRGYLGSSGVETKARLLRLEGARA
ncbi:MAG: methylated-DNA--[protein]-cysteine S-methyltransferase [Anaerolineales bacterium]|nr:methylated-DNA--[protein]-cysteine S-methyltransferase [Anaerolineales bacterium]